LFQEIMAREPRFFPLERQRQIPPCVFERNRCVQKIISGRQLDLLISRDQREILQVHVLVAHQETEEGALQELHALDGRESAELLDDPGHLLHRGIALGPGAQANR